METCRFRKLGSLQTAGLVLLVALSDAISVWTQTIAEPTTSPGPAVQNGKQVDADFRVETMRIDGGAELITIFAKQSSLPNTQREGTSELPLISILRDTLGDSRPENDRLRFVWMLTYTKPSFWQKAAAFAPFLYTRTSNKGEVGKSPPPPIADMQASDKAMWNKIMWLAFRKIVLGQAGMGPRASALQYRQNAQDYRRSAMTGTLAVLSLYEKVNDEKLLSDQEVRDIQSRLWLSDSTFGGMLRDDNLDRVYEKRTALIEDNRGHNWELLRQYSEAQGLYFEPLLMPDGAATHAMVWTTAEDLKANRDKKFDGRFLNFKNPWQDDSLLSWKGYTQESWFDADGRICSPDAPGATKRTMIPLALYGLDTTKIPGILIDFRNDRNAKRREMSRRVLNDITGNVLSISKFGNLPFLLGRTVLDFATGRRGTDINQASRVRSYSQLKMLLALDDSLDADLRDDLAERIEDVSLNPLENDIEVEARIARAQYRNLVDYAKRPDGLPAKLTRDRREEMVRYADSKKQQMLFGFMHAMTLGLYTHRENSSEDLVARMDTGRQLQFHERIVNEIAYRSVRPEVDSDINQLRESLLFMAENGTAAGSKTARSLSKIFAMTADDDMRRLCITALYQIDNSTAKSELLAIYRNPKVDGGSRDLSAQLLRRSVAEGKRVSSRTAAGVAALAPN